MQKPDIIRLAVLDDATAIANVFRVTWPEEKVSLPTIQTVLDTQTHVTHVALYAQQVVGFVDSFTTLDRLGQPRWEVDLLAVHPAHRGQGHATRLLQATISWAQNLKIPLARGLVRIGNTRAEIAFQKAQFFPKPSVCSLYTSNRLVDHNCPNPGTLHLVSVQTMSYSGLWVEADFSAESLAYALASRSEQSLDVVGVVIPAEHAAIAMLEDRGFALVGRYRWWSRLLLQHHNVNEGNHVT